MSEEIKIITLGDIFKNIETEEKAFKFKDYIKDLQQKVEQLEKENEKLKYLVDDSHTMKAFIVEHNKVEQLENIRKEAIKYIEYYCIGNLEYENKTHKVLLNILNKGGNNGK